MKKALKIILPLLLLALIFASIAWYLFDYDRAFMRDMLLQEARFFSDSGNTRIASFFYDLAYRHSGQDESVAIELSNQYKSDGNYTKAEYTLINAIEDGPTIELYTALSKVFVEQDKLLDAVTLLDNISDPVIKAQISSLRPSIARPDPEPDFYSEYITVTLGSTADSLYYTLDGDYPSTSDTAYSEPISLDQGQTVIKAVAVDKSGLVSSLMRSEYTITGVIEPIELTDPAFEQSIRELLELSDDEVIYTNMLWDIKEFTLPEDAQSLSDLSALPYLEKLIIQNHEIDSLSVLSSLTYLKELDLSASHFSAEDLTYLAALPELETLSLKGCALSTIANLANAPALSSLDLGSNTLRNLDALSNMFTLRQLKLDHNAVTSLSALSSLTNLEVLDLSYNSIQSLSPLETCTALRELNVENNLLTSLTALSALTNITVLNVSGNSISDVGVLSSCADLTTLDISSNRITDISALRTLTALETFDFSSNQVSALPEWGEGCALRSISGSNNLLESIDVLKNMEDLCYIYMDYNNISSIDAVADCYHLVLVNVYANPITDVSALTQHNIIVNYDPTNG